MSELKKIYISGILTDLDNGLSRPEIAAKYEISPAEVKALFEHPKLKGKKAKKKLVLTFVIEDDIYEPVNDIAANDVAADDVTTETQEEVVTENATPVEDTTSTDSSDPIFS